MKNVMMMSDEDIEAMRKEVEGENDVPDNDGEPEFSGGNNNE